VGLERGPLSLVSITEELLGRKSSGCGLENRKYGRRNPLRCVTQKWALTSPISGGRSVGIIRSRSQDTGVLLTRIREVLTSCTSRDVHLDLRFSQFSSPPHGKFYHINLTAPQLLLSKPIPIPYSATTLPSDAIQSRYRQHHKVTYRNGTRYYHASYHLQCCLCHVFASQSRLPCLQT
jgi:hypothetical protein